MSQPSSVKDETALPPIFNILRISTSFWSTQALYAVTKFKIPDALAGGQRKTAEMIAHETGTNADALFRCLRMLSSMNIFKAHADRTFENNDASEMLVSNHPSGARSTVLAEAGPVHYKMWANFDETLRTGQASGLSAFGYTQYFDSFKEFPDHAAVFSAHMSAVSAGILPAFLEHYSFEGVSSIVDVGGAEGALVLGVYNKYKDNIKDATTYDMPQVIEHNKTLAAHERHRLPPPEIYKEVGGNFFAVPSDIPAGKDVYIIKNILHDWADCECLKIFASIKSVMRDDSKIVVIEAVVTDGTEPTYSKFLDLHMMHIAGGRERSSDEWHALAASAGLKVNKIVQLNARETSVIEIVKA
eukprot:TRINITY_DN21147_c0_g1_i1.p1 TRINITY_DN21147_c0_g1~~TRINITY_DN21147_c0_g1_i1.p1  ORF type:complete len:370 (-),score=43.84 TRINITY_DN21147_c0_g1_i1:18-1091(-)